METSFKPPIIAFVSSAILTVAAYSMRYSAGWVMSLATLQGLIQIVCYYGLGFEEKPHWNLVMFLFMALVLFVVIGGSLWIMYNLNYDVMPEM